MCETSPPAGYRILKTSATCGACACAMWAWRSRPGGSSQGQGSPVDVRSEMSKSSFRSAFGPFNDALSSYPQRRPSAAAQSGLGSGNDETLERHSSCRHILQPLCRGRWPAASTVHAAGALSRCAVQLLYVDACALQFAMVVGQRHSPASRRPSEGRRTARTGFDPPAS